MVLHTKVRKFQEGGQKGTMQHPKKKRTGKCPRHCQPHVEQWLWWKQKPDCSGLRNELIFMLTLRKVSF